jgi:hypothetical protein
VHFQPAQRGAFPNGLDKCGGPRAADGREKQGSLTQSNPIEAMRASRGGHYDVANRGKADHSVRLSIRDHRSTFPNEAARITVFSERESR